MESNNQQYFNEPISASLDHILDKTSKLAFETQRKSYDIEHFLICYFLNPDSFIKDIFDAFDVPITELDLESIVFSIVKTGSSTEAEPKPSKKLRDFLKTCESSSGIIFSKSVFISAIYDESIQNGVAKALEKFGIDLEGLKALLDVERDGIDADELEPLNEEEYEIMNNMLKEQLSKVSHSSRRHGLLDENKILESFCENLNIKASEGKFDDLFDIHSKGDKIAAIITRKKKSNAILVGRAGTGKSSIVEHLAKSIIDGSAPEVICDYVVYSMNVSSLVAGTMYRGQMEQKLDRFCKEIIKWDNVILFIDEIHTILGAGASKEDSLDFANIMKPYLSNGSIKCIGATTDFEYNSTIKKDAALDRRFEKITIKEPSRNIMVEILKKSISHYSDYHGVIYPEDITEKVLDYCDAFMKHRTYPDKAFDVFDQMGSMAKIRSRKLPKKLKDIEQTIREGKSTIETEDEYYKGLAEMAQGFTLNPPLVLKSDLDSIKNDSISPIFKEGFFEGLSIDFRNELVSQGKLLSEFQDFSEMSKFGLNEKSGVDTFLILNEENQYNTDVSKVIENSVNKFDGSTFTLDGENSRSHLMMKIFGEKSDYDVNLFHHISMNSYSTIIINNFDKMPDDAKAIIISSIKSGELHSPFGKSVNLNSCQFILIASAKKVNSIGFGGEQSLQNPFQDVFGKLTTSLALKTGKLRRLDERGVRRVVYNKIKALNKRFSQFDKKIQISFDELKKISRILVTDKSSNINDVFADKIEAKILKKCKDNTKIIEIKI